MEFIGKQKYRNKPTIVDGIRFDSKKEAARYQELKLLEKSKLLTKLRVHTAWPIEVNGQEVCKYKSDFDYLEPGELVETIEDVKSPATRKLSTYRLKKKLMFAVYGIEIREI